jgi:ATP synthase protein I
MDSSNKKDEKDFSGQIARKEKRKLKAQRVSSGSVWSGLGMFGMVGWSVAIPTLLGAALGIWLDKHYPETFSWVLSFLMIGLITGCIIAWYWIAREDKEIHQDKEKNDK